MSDIFRRQNFLVKNMRHATVCCLKNTTYIRCENYNNPLFTASGALIALRYMARKVDFQTRKEFLTKNNVRAQGLKTVLKRK